MTKFVFPMMFAASLFFAVACSDDTTKGNSDAGGGSDAIAGDSGGTKSDATEIVGDSGAGDSGGAKSGDWVCLEVAKCLASCTEGDKNCPQGCIDQGTLAAQQALKNLSTCIDNAVSGTCKANCTDPAAKTCTDCTDTACANDYKACSDQVTEGFGDACSDQNPCKGSLKCTKDPDLGDKGFCTKSCTEEGQFCPGAPAGAFAACIFPDPTLGKVCGFICKADEDTYQCPSSQNCDENPNPPGSKQYICQVKP